jgi:hypothetical protein
MTDYEERLKEERAELHALNLKIIKALSILGIEAKIDKYRTLDIGDVPSLENQDLWVRTNSYKHKGKIEVELSYKNKDFNNNYLDKDKYQRIEVNVSASKSAEVIASDIKRRVIESAQARDNEAYLIGVKFRNEEYKNKKDTDRLFMSKCGIDLNGKDTANYYQYMQGGSLDITVSSNSELSHSSIELKGLNESQWLKVFALTNEIITESKNNTKEEEN